MHGSADADGGTSSGARPVGADDAWPSLLDGRVPADVAGPASAELVSRYGPLVAAGPRLVLAQLGQSLDGFVAARTGDAVFVTGEEDRRHLHRLRALTDAVVVGVSTVAADDCRLTVREVAGPSPVRVVLDPRARLPRGARLLGDDGPRVLWCVGRARAPEAAAEGRKAEVVGLPTADGRFAPAEVLATLAARGLGRVLVEGGGRTVSAFLAAGVLDRLLVTTAPLLVGDGVPGLRFAGEDRLADALRPPARRFALGADSCLELDLSAVRGRRPT
ncbi:RibD family protein [Pseudokineococcus basanitobsidens]|uniref:RibD family protein n=1 Tax=Pseudokineococcus basanitobsidens TaxID=1926649 RepID=A0ABU8RH88_9ACTN